MLANYAKILRWSAALTAVVAAVMVAVSAAAAGSKGLIGALLGVALVTAFFGISVVAVGRAARVSPQAMMLTAIVTYLVKILVLLFLVGRFMDTTAFSTRLFGLTAIVCILAWSGAQVVTSMRLRVPYVEPSGER